MKKNTVFMLAIIFTAALLLRINAVMTQDMDDRVLKSDEIGYDEMAVNLAAGNGLSQVTNGSLAPIAYRTPVYPIFLAGIYSVFGHDYMTVKLIQAVIGALFCIVIFLIANAIYQDQTIGLMSALLVALYKPFISEFGNSSGPVHLLTEYLLIFILGLAVLSAIYFIKKGNKVTGAACGIFTGLAVLTRSEFVIFPIIFAFYLLSLSKSIKAFIKKYFVVYLFILLTMSPWIARNYIVFREFIPLTTTGGVIFWMGNNSSANGSNFEFGEMKNISDNRENKEFFKKGIKELSNNPGRIPMLFVRKIMVHWAPFENGFKLFNPYYAAALFFAVVGILFFRKKVMTENIIIILFLSTTLSAVIMFGHPRYRFPYEPYLLVFSAAAINGMINKVKGRFVCQK